MQSGTPEPQLPIIGDGDGGPRPIPVRITTVSPIAGALAGGITVTLTGRGFQQGAEVYFGDTPSPEVIVLSGLRAQAKLPAATQTGTVDVSLYNPDGSEATKPGGFTYVVTGTGAAAEVLGVSPLSVIEDTESEVTLRGHNLIEAYTNGMLALRGPTRAQVTVLNSTNSRDEATGIEELTFTVRVTAAPPLGPLERLAVQVLASRRPGAAGDGVFESSRQMFTVLPRARPVPLAYSAGLDPGRPNLVVIAGRNLEGCSLDLGEGATVHLQRSEDRFVAGIVTLQDSSDGVASPQLFVRDAGGDEVAQYAMWVGVDGDLAAATSTQQGEVTENPFVAAVAGDAGPAQGSINLTLTAVPGQQVIGPTAEDSAVFSLNEATSSSLFFDWTNFEITILDLTFVLPIVHEVHLIPFFDGVSADELSDLPVLAQVGRLFRLRGVGLLVALHVDIVVHISVVLIIGFIFEVWDFGLFNEFPEYGWVIGSVVIGIRIEIEIIFILSFLLAAVLPQGRLRVIFAFNLIAELDFKISDDGHHLLFGYDFHVEHTRIGPALNNLLPCDGRFQLASDNGQTVFPDAFGGHQSFYFPRSEGECCLPWDFDLRLVRSVEGQPEETVQGSFRAAYCLNAEPSSDLIKIVITSVPPPEPAPRELVMNLDEDTAALRALAVPVDANGVPTGEPARDVRELGFGVEFYLESSLDVVLNPAALLSGNAFPVQTGDNVISVRLTSDQVVEEGPLFTFWPGGVRGFDIAGPLAEGGMPRVVMVDTLPVSVKGTITVEPTLAYEDANGNLVETTEIERYEPFETPQRQYVLAAKVTVPQSGSLPSSLEIKVDEAKFAQAPLGGIGISFAESRDRVDSPARFFTGALASDGAKGALTLSRDMQGDKLIKVPGLTIQANQVESVVNGVLQLVPPGRQVTNRDVVLSVKLYAESRGAKVRLVGRPLDWKVVNEETFEEYPRGFVEVKSILSGSDVTITKFRDFAATFYSGLKRNPPAPPALPAANVLIAKGEELWNLAWQAVQGVAPLTKLLDDRPLYWARLQFIAALRAISRRNNLTVSPTTISQFELPSRGLNPADGSIVFPPEAANTRRAIVTGYDPFALPTQPDQCNPSGLAALALNARRVGPSQSSVYVRTAVFPVRYRDFDDGVVEKAVTPRLGSIVLLMTCSQGRNFYDVERFAGKNRGRVTIFDNERMLNPGRLVTDPATQLPNTIGLTDPEGRTIGGPQFLESTLPYTRVITSDVATRLLPGPQSGPPFIDDTGFILNQHYVELSGSSHPKPNSIAPDETWQPLPIAPSGIAEAGSGDNFLSNEIFYRTALVRSTNRPSLSSGHLHVPPLGAQGNQPRTLGPGLLNAVERALTRFLEDRFRMRSSGDITFPRTNVNTTSAPITLSAIYDKNKTGETINAFSVDVSPPFAVQWPGPTPIPLGPGTSLPLQFTFRPTTPGVHTQTVKLRDVNGEVLLTATLTGEGVPTYTIAGQVALPGGVPLQGVQVTLAGSRTGPVTTGMDGRYSFAGLDAGGNYTVTPSHANYTFTPPSRSFSGLAADQSADFAATLNRHRIRGRVRLASGLPVSNATVTLYGAVSGTAVTDASGEYLFDGLPEGGSYTVSVSRANYSFALASQVFNNLLADTDFDFTGTLVSYKITGRVMSGSVGLEGVTVTLSGSQSLSTTTDASGDYSFTVMAEGNYTVTASKAHYAFSPQSAGFSNLGANQAADFTATLNRHRISGRVTTAAGAGIPGVALTLSGLQSPMTATSDASGNYSFVDLPAGVNYTLTPSHANYTFTAASLSFNDLGADQMGGFAGALVSYTISGRVTIGNAGLAGVAVSLSGSRNDAATTDASGNYSFTIPAEGSYTVTPSKAHYTFAPQSLSFNNLSGNQSAAFSATLDQHTVSGRITSTGGAALANVTLNLSGLQPGTATTDASGNYSFANLPAGGNYTITPSRPNYTFTPASRSFTDLGANQTADFIDALVSYTISGRVTIGGAGLPGVTVNLSGSKTSSATTDASGNYSFVVLAEGNYTVTPSASHYTFTPPSASFNNLSANQSADFGATLKQHTISGRATTPDGAALAGITVNLSGSGTATAITDASGNYSFADLPAGGSYTVTASRTNYAFATASRSFGDLGANQTADFTGSLVSYTIGGRVTGGGAGLPGVTVTLSGSRTSSATSDASGNYSFSVPAEGNYTVTPSKTHYALAPQSAAFSNLSANQSADFSATLKRHTISGRVTTAGGVALPNVTLRLSGSQSNAATSDASGNYSFTDLPAGGSYTVTAVRANYAFTPGSRSFGDLGADQAADFTGALVNYTIGGRITKGDTGFAGVTVELSGSRSAAATTDASGNYSFTVTAEGNYTVTPSRQFYTFAPQSAVFGSLGADQTANFNATLNQHTVSGRITTAEGVALSNVTVRLSGSQTATATTDASGNYSFANLPAGGCYTLTPSRANYAFTPASQSFSSIGANQTADFVAALVRYTLSGRVALNGQGLAGVTVTLGGSEAGTVTTGASGDYSFTVTAEGNYTVTPSKHHYTFAPQSPSFSNLGGNQTTDFIATLERHTISGRVTTAAGTALPGVTVGLSGSQNAAVTTDAAGGYTFADLLAGGDYTITPSRAHHTFAPDSHSFSDLGASQAADFLGAPVSYTIGGRVTGGGAGLPGVTVILGGSQTATATTDDAGSYSFSVPAEGSYTLALSEPHHTFTPPGASFDNLTANETADFSAALKHHTLSGRVTAADGTGMPGVAVTLSGAQSGATNTDASGSYSFADLVAGGSYTVTAARANYTFEPNSLSFDDLIASQTADFTGSLVSYTIGGRVTGGGAGLPGVAVKLSGSEAADTVTDGAGNYSFSVTAEGNYTVSPSEHYAFTPPDATFDDLAADRSADFSAPPAGHRVSGRVTNPVGDALPNVTLALSGSRTATAKTDADGNYSFANLPEGGNYTVTPALFGYTFATLSHTFYGLSADQATDFSAGPVGGVRINLALQPEGPVFSVSTMYKLGRGVRAVINGDIRSVVWRGAPPDGSVGWLDVSFAGEKEISEVHVFSTQDNSAAYAELVEALPFTQHGLQDLDVEYWTDAGWRPVPEGAVTNNNRVWVKVAFPPLRTTVIRIVVRRALGG